MIYKVGLGPKGDFVNGHVTHSSEGKNHWQEDHHDPQWVGPQASGQNLQGHIPPSPTWIIMGPGPGGLLRSLLLLCYTLFAWVGADTFFRLLVNCCRFENT